MELGSGLYSSVCVVTVHQTRPPRNVGSSFHRARYSFLQKNPDHVQGPPSLMSGVRWWTLPWREADHRLVDAVCRHYVLVACTGTTFSMAWNHKTSYVSSSNANRFPLFLWSPKEWTMVHSPLHMNPHQFHKLSFCMTHFIFSSHLCIDVLSSLVLSGVPDEILCELFTPRSPPV